MTLPHKGSRPIHLRGYDLRWRHLSGPTHLRARIIIQGTGKGQLRIHSPENPEPGRKLGAGEVATPQVVAKWVAWAMDQGWDPAGNANLDLNAEHQPHWLDENDAPASGFIPEHLPTPRPVHADAPTVTAFSKDKT